MELPKESSFLGRKEIGNVCVQMMAMDDKSGYQISIKDFANPNEQNDSDGVLMGLSAEEAKEFFESICADITEGSSIQEVCDTILKYAEKLKAAEADAKQLKQALKEGRGAVQEAVKATVPGRFRAKETVNNIEISVGWMTDKRWYEMYLPDARHELIIGEEKERAKAVFEYAKKEAVNVGTAEQLLDKVAAFLSNDLKEPAPEVARPKPQPVEKKEPLFKATRREEVVNGVKIVLGSYDGNSLNYYLTFPGFPLWKLTQKVQTDGRLNVTRDPSGYFEKAKKLAEQGRPVDDIFITIWHQVR